MGDTYQNSGKTVYLMLMFHQHQPFYYDKDLKNIIAPWVRTHTTKDYNYIPYLIKKFPNVHITINLTPSLLTQIQDGYVKNLKTHLHIIKEKRKTNQKIPSIELLLNLLIKPTQYFNKEDILNLYCNHFSALSVNEVVRCHFPEYDKIYKIFSEARQKKALITNTQLLRELKFWFALVNFNPEFFENPIKLEDGEIIDLTDIVVKRSDHKYYLRKKITEAECKRLVIETYKLLNNFLTLHKNLAYSYQKGTGQIELSTSPYSHPIIPLLIDTESARENMGNIQLPPRFHYTEDANMHIKMGIEIFQKYFGFNPNGIWPSEGSVSSEALKIFSKHNFDWFATDVQILHNSLHQRISHFTPYNFKIEGKNIVGFFRDTNLSDKISFKYQNYDGEDSADDLIKHILSYSSPDEERVVSVILDGENAWEWYRIDFGAREFFTALFRKLEKLFFTKQIITITPIEYIKGNPNRGIVPHPAEKLPNLKTISSGSWIQGNFSKWIGNKEKNLAWEILLQARKAIESSGLTFEYLKSIKKRNRTEKYLYKAYEYLYIAEGSDWFWWIGEDQESFESKPFDDLFLNYINQIYHNLERAGLKIEVPKILLSRETKKRQTVNGSPIKTMAIGGKYVNVKFLCDAHDLKVPDSIYIAGNVEQLGGWIPNLIRMKKIQDQHKKHQNIWEYEINVLEGTEIQYKYTNSGKKGEWGNSEEFPALNRSIIVKSENGNEIIIKDKFGKL